MPRRDFGMVSTNTLEIRQSPISLLPDVQPIFTLTVSGSGEIGNSPTMKIYKGSKDVSNDLLTGVMSVTNRRITLKQISGLTPGEYVFYVTFTDGGQQTCRFCRLHVGKVGI